MADEAEDWNEPPPVVRSDSLPEASSSAVRSTAQTLEVDTMIGGRYRVIGILGKGGFGTVYTAEHVELHRKIALKLLHPHMTEDKGLFLRFQQEARTSAAIGHPNIVQVFDLGHDEKGAFIAMELLEGEELEDRILRGPMPEADVARIGAEVADAMAAAHENGVIHRDLKPQNVFLSQQGRRKDMVKVIDFGIAKLIDRRVGEDLTATGQLFGTPRYMAPEQLRGTKEIDGRVDVYAIGALLHRALTASYPFDGATYPELLLSIMSDPALPIRPIRPDVSPRMIQIVEKAMTKQREHRFQDARSLADALYHHIDNPGDAWSVSDPSVQSLADTGSLELMAGAQPATESSSSMPIFIGAGVLGAIALLLTGLGVFALTSGMLEPEETPSVATETTSEAIETASYRVEMTAEPETAEFVLDGESLGAGAIDHELELDGTPHILVVQASSHDPVAITFRDAPPEQTHVTLERLAPGAPEPTSPVAEAVEEVVEEVAAEEVAEPPADGAAESARSRRRERRHRRALEAAMAAQTPPPPAVRPAPPASPASERGTRNAPIVY